MHYSVLDRWSCHYRGPELSIFCLKYSEYFFRKGVVRRHDPVELGLCYTEQFPAPPWDLCSVPPLLLISWRRAGCACRNKSPKKPLHIGGMHQVNDKREQIVTPHVLFHLFHSRLSQLHRRGPRRDLKTGYVLCPLSPFSCFCPLLCMGKTQPSYSVAFSLLNFVMGVWRFWAVACEPAPLSSLLWELALIEGCCTKLRTC